MNELEKLHDAALDAYLDAAKDVYAAYKEDEFALYLDAVKAAYAANKEAETYLYAVEEKQRAGLTTAWRHKCQAVFLHKSGRSLVLKIRHRPSLIGFYAWWFFFRIGLDSYRKLLDRAIQKDGNDNE